LNVFLKFNANIELGNWFKFHKTRYQSEYKSAWTDFLEATQITQTPEQYQTEKKDLDLAKHGTPATDYSCTPIHIRRADRTQLDRHRELQGKRRQYH
jgi:hypothetical protein